MLGVIFGSTRTKIQFLIVFLGLQTVNLALAVASVVGIFTLQVPVLFRPRSPNRGVAEMTDYLRELSVAQLILSAVLCSQGVFMFLVFSSQLRRKGNITLQSPQDATGATTDSSRTLV